MKNNQLPFFLLVIALFLGLTGPSLFADGMFLDGLTYAGISRNMANDIGSFWTPHYTDSLFPAFYEHPPLALGLESIAFRLFGDSIYVERIYSLATFVLTGYFIALIWRELAGTLRTAWLPLLFWITVSTVPWACSNNLLENTMQIFTTLSAWVYLRSRSKNYILWIVLSGLALSMALLAKGPVCLYIWSLPFFDWLWTRREKFSKMVFNTFLMIGATALPIAILFFYSDEAQSSLSNYFSHQVIWNSQHITTVNSRFAILGDFAEAIAIPALISGLIIFIAYLKKQPMTLMRKQNKWAFVLFSVVLAGVLPIMVSWKQSSFYILTVYPFFALGLSLIMWPLTERIVSTPSSHSGIFKLLWIAGPALLIISIAVSISRVNKIGRDKNLLNDCYAVISQTGRNQSISICPEMFKDWKLHAYYARYGNISLIPYSKSSQSFRSMGSRFYLSDSVVNSENYFLTNGTCQPPAAGFINMYLPLNEYKLFKAINR